MHNKMWDEIIYPFLNFNGCTVEIKEWISNFIPHFIMDVIHLSTPGLKLNHAGTERPILGKMSPNGGFSWQYGSCDKKLKLLLHLIEAV